MLLMESYLFCASVRWGVLAISAACVLRSLIVMYIILTNGIEFMFSMITVFENDAHYRTSSYIQEALRIIEKYPTQLLLLAQFICIAQIIACLTAAYGAYRLKRNHIIPLFIFECMYTVQNVSMTVLALQILRHLVGLTTLIMLTLAMTFYDMLVTYDTLALLAFIQIVNLVKSKQYQRIYGSDPFHPVLRTTVPENVILNKITTTQPISIYVIPEAGQKVEDIPQTKWWHGKSVKVFNQMDVISNNFQRHELLSDVLLRNAVKGDYIYREKMKVQKEA